MTWQDGKSEEGCRELLSQQSDAGVEALLETCTRGKRVETREGKMEAILNACQSAEGLLKRQLFTKDVLMKYAIFKGIKVLSGLTRGEIQRRIIKYWRSQKPQSDDTRASTPKHPQISPARPENFQNSSSSSTNLQVVHSVDIKTETISSAPKPPYPLSVSPQYSQVGEKERFEITSAMQSSSSFSRQDRQNLYQQPLEEQKSADAGRKRNAIIDEISRLKAKRTRLEEDSANLSKTSYCLSKDSIALREESEAKRAEAEAKRAEAEAERDEAEAKRDEAEAKRAEAEAKRAEAVALSSTIEEKRRQAVALSSSIEEKIKALSA